MNKIALRVSSSIVNFRLKAEKTWGLERYKWPQDIFKKVCFFGMYHIGDYFHFIRHLGPKTIVWAGSDISNLFKNILPWEILFKKATHYCENELERQELRLKGIKARVRPTFLEEVSDFPVCFESTEKPQVYLSARPNREKEYGVELIQRIAPKVPEVTFHIFGFDALFLKQADNIIYEGNVSEEQFNSDIKNYQCGLRPLEHDGFSEILAKSILMGQYPISRIKYPKIDSYKTEEELVILLKDLKNKKEPNYKAREFWIKNLNDFPFIKH